MSLHWAGLCRFLAFPEPKNEPGEKAYREFGVELEEFFDRGDLFGMLFEQIGGAGLEALRRFNMLRFDTPIGKKLPENEGGEEEKPDFKGFFEYKADNKADEPADGEIADRFCQIGTPQFLNQHVCFRHGIKILPKTCGSNVRPYRRETALLPTLSRGCPVPP